jgi:hypothetical protein
MSQRQPTLTQNTYQSPTALGNSRQHNGDSTNGYHGAAQHFGNDINIDCKPKVGRNCLLITLAFVVLITVAVVVPVVVTSAKSAAATRNSYVNTIRFRTGLSHH